MINSFDVVGLGWGLVDLLMIVPRYPELDTKTESSISIQQVGGPVPRAMITLAKLGKETSLIASVGDDFMGNFMRKSLKSEGVNIDDLNIQPHGISRFGSVWIEENKGARTIVYYQGRLQEIRLTEHVKSVIRNAKILHLDGRELESARIAARLARENGCKVTLDTGDAKQGIEHLFPLVDIIKVPFGFMKVFFPDMSLKGAAKKLQALGPRLVIVTLGSEGTVVFSEGGSFKQPGFPIKKVVDTNGAGDAFSGGLLYGILENWDIEKTVRFASAVAALKCANLGNTGLPSLQEASTLLERKNVGWLCETDASGGEICHP